MPHRVLVAKELAELLGVLAHPNRIRITEELRDGERDVNSLQAALGSSHPGVSQHLMLLRLHCLVSERRQGRQVFYRLRQPELAAWLTKAMASWRRKTWQPSNFAKRLTKPAPPGRPTTRKPRNHRTSRRLAGDTWAAARL